jgi:GH24 family phage-related lysozyme (muramidase)
MTAGSRISLILGAIALLLLIPSGSAAAAIIQKFEGFRSVPYWDANGWAIGYGSHYNYDAGRPVRQTDRINQQTALKWLNIAINENARLLDRVVNVPISTNQRDSLLSFIYNIGGSGFLNSTLLQKINQKRPKSETAAEFDRWIYSDGAINPVLVKRRKLEKALFLS